MRNFHSSVTDLRRSVAGEFESFPYECGWADEAIYFVTVEEGAAPEVSVEARVQVSADGIRWLEEGATIALRGASSTFVRISHFGGFLRLAGSAPADGVVLTVRLALKG